MKHDAPAHYVFIDADMCISSEISLLLYKAFHITTNYSIFLEFAGTTQELIIGLIRNNQETLA